MKKSLLIYILIFFIILIGIIIFKDTKQENKNTVVFWTLQLSSFENYINNIISEFEEENPNVKIKWIDVPYAEGEKRTLAAILTDNPPDLVNLTPDFSMLLAQKNALENIAQEKLEQFLPTLTETLKYNNEYFGIPFYATSAITLYNKELTNKEISTFDELFDIKLDNAQTTMLNLAENDTLLKLLNKYDINSPEKLTSQASINLFKKIKYMYDENIIPKESITQSHRDTLEKYMSGKLGYIVTGANFLTMIKENAPTIYENTEILPQLTGTTNKYDYSLMNFIIPKKSKNKDNALKFALYFTNEKNQLELAKMTTILPANQKALDDDYFKISENSLQSKARIISSKQLTNLQEPLKNIKNKKELNTISANYIQEILINNANIEKTLEDFAQDWQKL